MINFNCSAAEVTEAVCLPSIGRNIFLHVADDQMFFVVISKVQNEQGILLFVHWNLD